MKKTHQLISGLSALALAAGAFLLFPSLALSDDADQALIAKANALFKPLPASSALENSQLTPVRVSLGKALFYETRVSSDGRLGCVTCHNPA